MQLLDLAVENWRGLTGQLGPFSPHLNLISGPNESGKSRFFQAIRYALTESYKGKSREKANLQSWQSDLPPRVTLAFEANGVRWQITKQFLKKPYAELQGDGRTLKDEAAEARLRELLGTSAGNGRKVVPEDLGVWRLLLVEQGSSRAKTSEHLNEDTRSDLGRRLSAELGVMTLSAQDAELMREVETEWSRYFTPTGQEGTELRRLRQALANAETALTEAQAAYAQQQQNVRELTDARAQIGDLTGRLDDAGEAAREAAEQAERAREAKAEIDDITRQHKAAEDALEIARKDLRDRVAAAQTVATQTAALAERRQTAAALESTLAAHEQALREARAEYAEANESLTRAQARARRARSAVERQALVARKGEIEKKIDALTDLDVLMVEARQALAALPVMTPADLTRLRELAQNVTLAKARLDASAVALDIAALTELTVDGEPLLAGESKRIRVTDAQAIQIEHVATVTLHPPAGSLTALAEALARAEQDFADACLNQRVPDLDTAVDTLEQRKALERQVEQLQSRMTQTSPDSMSELRQQIAEVDATLSTLAEDAMPEAVGEEGVDLQGTPQADLQVVLDAEQAALQRRTVADDRRDAAQAKVDEVRPQVVEERGAVQIGESNLVHAEQTLAAFASEAELAARIAEAEASLRATTAVLAAKRSAFEGLGGEVAMEAAARKQRAVEILRERSVEAQKRVATLEGTLTEKMKAGSHEACQDCEADFTLAERELNRTVAAAEAANRLKQVLEAQRRAMVEQWLAPVRARVEPYVRIIFPGASVQADEQLDFAAFSTGNMEEAFEALSGGAQEQFSLMTRIGLAEVLADAERLPLVLDDSLINSDASRIARVHGALDRAAKNLQVILFTCHESFFDQLGAQYSVRLQPTRD